MREEAKRQVSTKDPYDPVRSAFGLVLNGCDDYCDSTVLANIYLGDDIATAVSARAVSTSSWWSTCPSRWSPLEGRAIWPLLGTIRTLDCRRRGNIRANPRLRLRFRRRRYAGTARLMPEDDARARLRSLPRINNAAVAAIGSELLTVRIDPDE